MHGFYYHLALTIHPCPSYKVAADPLLYNRHGEGLSLLNGEKMHEQMKI